jgi:hypothetical protein
LRVGAEADAPPRKRGVARFFVIVLLACLSPVTAMTYAGLTYNRLMQWVTAAVALTGIATAELTALDQPDGTGALMVRHYGFIAAQGVAMNVFFSVLAAVALTQLTPGWAPGASRRRNASWASVAAVLVVMGIYGPLAYKVQTSHDRKTLQTAKDALLKDAAVIEKSTGPDKVSKERADLMTYMNAIGQPAGKHLGSDSAFEMHQRMHEECAAGKSPVDPSCLAEMAMEAPVPTAEPSRWQALGHALNPGNALFPGSEQTTRSTTPPAASAKVGKRDGD